MKTFRSPVRDLLLTGICLALSLLITACNSGLDSTLTGSDKTTTIGTAVESQEDNTTLPPAPPLMKALDADQDGILSAAEIDNATAALKTLDANGDGTLTRNELCPPRSEGLDEDNTTESPPCPGYGPDRGMHGRFGPPGDPLLRALDADQDGTLSAAEIDNAPAALKTLDTNEDGALTQDELRPPQPEDLGEDNATRPVPPLVKALDANQDGILSAVEIDNATLALKTLDANGDGTLTQDELFPALATDFDADNATKPPPCPGFGPERGRHGHFGPLADPLLKALDADQDGILSAAELDNATTALKTLDTNGDGTLTHDELFPAPAGTLDADNATEPPSSPDFGPGRDGGPFFHRPVRF